MRWFVIPMLIVLAALIILLEGCSPQPPRREVPDAGVAFSSRRAAGEAEIVYDELVIHQRPARKKPAARKLPRGAR